MTLYQVVKIRHLRVGEDIEEAADDDLLDNLRDLGYIN